MHTGTGRIARMMMRTMSLYELKESTGEISLGDLFDGKTGMFGQSKLSIDDITYALLRGGWPETAEPTSCESRSTLYRPAYFFAYEQFYNFKGSNRK